MRTDAKDLALSMFQRGKERCDRQRGLGEQSKESTCDDGPPATPGVASQGSMAMKVYNTELIHRKWLLLAPQLI